MYKYVEWENLTSTGNDIADEFIRLAKLNSIDSKIIEDRRDLIPQYRTAMNIGKSKEYITKRIKSYLIPKYDEISKQFPDILPSLNNGENNPYKSVCVIVSIETKNKIYSIKIQNKDFYSFKHIRLYVIEKIEEKYGIKLDEIGDYETYISGGYHLVNKKRGD